MPGAPSFTFGDSLPTSPKEGDTHYFAEQGQDADGNAAGYTNPVRYDGSAWVWAVEPLRFYVVDRQDDRVYVYKQGGARVEGLEFDLVAANDSPSGLAVTSTRLYVLDGVDERVYVYDHDGNQQSGEEFNLATATVGPFGIAVTSSRIYVVDGSASRVYAYTNAGVEQTGEELQPRHG